MLDSTSRYAATSFASFGEASIRRGSRPFSISHRTTAVSPAPARLSAQSRTEAASQFANHSLASARVAGGVSRYSETNAASSSFGVAAA